MALCFSEAFDAKHEHRISEEEYIGHLTAHLRGIRHPSDDLNDKSVGERLRRRSSFTALFREFALSNHTLSAEETKIYDQLILQCSVGDFNSTKSSFARLEGDESLRIPLQALAVLTARKGHAKILDFLLQNGAKLDEEVETSAGQAVDTAEMIELLWGRNWCNIQHSLKVQDSMVWRSIHRPVGMLEFLLRQGAKIPLELFRVPNVGKVSLPVMKTLIRECGIDPLRGTAVLAMAVKEGHRDVVEFLCQQGVPVNDVPPDPDPREPRWCSPLYTTIQNRDISMMELLLEHGADPDAPYADHHQESVLHAVQESGDKELLSVLEKHACRKLLRPKL